jgi:hypothetical protein
MQDGCTPAFVASKYGHTETLALLLANKADINAATKVQQFNIFKYLQLIGNEFQDFKITFLIISTILANENVNYYLTLFTLVLYAGWFYPSVHSFPKWTH